MTHCCRASTKLALYELLGPSLVVPAKDLQQLLRAIDEMIRFVRGEVLPPGVAPGDSDHAHAQRLGRFDVANLVADVDDVARRQLTALEHGPEAALLAPHARGGVDEFEVIEP